MAAPGSDLDVALDELEARLERLRSLYEQYFIGIEKIEPSIPRQDVDRRIYALRKVQIRNTAKRFKLQNIIQRYNTFQQYWLRICREIENGTYHRHVARAQSRFGDVGLTAAAKRRARLGNRTDEEQKEAAEQITRARESAEGDLAALLDEDPDAAMRNALAAAEQVVVKATPPAAPGVSDARAAGLSADAAKPGEGAGLSARPQLPPRVSAKGRQAPPVEAAAGGSAPAALVTGASSAPAAAGNGPSIAPSQAPKPGGPRAPGAPPPRKARGGDMTRADGRPGEPTLSAPPAAAAQPTVASAAASSPVALGNAGAAQPPAANPAAATGAAKRPFPRPVRHETGASVAPAAGSSPAAGGAQPVAPPPAVAEPAPAAAPRRVSRAPGPRRPTEAPPAVAVRAAPAVISASRTEPEPAITPAARAPAAQAPAAQAPAARAASIAPANAALAPSAGDAAKRRRSQAPARRSAAPAKASAPPVAKDQKAKEPRVDSWAALRVPANPQRSPAVGGKAPVAAAAEPRADAALRRNSVQQPAASVEPAPGKRTASASKPQTLPPATQASREVEPSRAQVVAPVPTQAAPSVAAPVAARPVRSEPSAAAAPDPAAAAAAARAAAAHAADLRAQSRDAAASRLDEQRLNQLHGALVAERRRLNQPGKISLEALGTSLRETETKLKKQYAGKAIDFHVVVKDGKAVVKPIIG